MYIRKTISKQGKKTYVNYLLVESIATPKGPRQKTICSLGDLGPRKREEWLKIARKMEDALSGQMTLIDDDIDPFLRAAIEKVEKRKTRNEQETSSVVGSAPKNIVAVDTDKVETENHREAGPVHAGLQMYKRLEIDEILKSLGFSDDACELTAAMVMNRLISPSSEHAMPGWFERTALSDILGFDFSTVNDDKLYRHMDRLYPLRGKIEALLSERERTLFNLEDTILLYDLTSSYFEGLMFANPQAKRGYSRDKRPDCKQVLIGLVLDPEGFPKAHEIYDGNRQDRTTVAEILDVLEARVGHKEGTTVVIDRGMAYDDNIQEIKGRGYHYLVAGRQAERNQWLAEFEEEGGWQEIFRESSPTNPFQEKTRVFIKAAERDGGTYVLCLSEGRKEKDRAIREKQECLLVEDLKKLQKRVETGKLKKPSAIHQSIGRLKERYPRVARYYAIEYDSAQSSLSWTVKAEARRRAEELDGGYILKTDRDDLSAEEIWNTYIMLTRVESAFRDMKSPLCERPIFHQIKRRTQTHIFLCVLAYHLLVTIEHILRQQGDHRSWETIREILKSHQVSTVILPTTSGDELHIRKARRAEPQHKDIYYKLRIPEKPMKPIRTWHSVTEKANSD
jgi:transposase